MSLSAAGRDALRPKPDSERSETSLRADEARLQSLVRILENDSLDEAELLEFALREAVMLTGSVFGYIYRYNEDSRRFTLNSWSQDVMTQCSVVDPQTEYELDKTGLWGEAVRQRCTILVNDYPAETKYRKGCPQGHVELRRFLTVPIFHGERIIAVVGVANKTPPYDSADERQLALLLSSVFSRLERVRAEVLLAESEARFKAVVGSMDDIVFTIDPEGRYTGVYGRWFGRFGNGPDSYLGKTNREILGAEVAAPQEAALALALKGQRASYEWTMEGENGTRSYQTVLSPVYSGTTITGAIGVGRDVTDLARSAETLARLLDDKDALLREVHHRVKNNLQVIVSIMNLERSRLAVSGAPPEVDAAYLRTQDRVLAMASVHDALYHSDGFSSVDLFSALQSQVSDLADTYSIQSHGTEIIVEPGELRLSLDRAVTCSLIVGELVTNSLLHAFPENWTAKRTVRIGADVDVEGNILLFVHDSGIGILEREETDEFCGFKLIKLLTEQIDGKFETRNDNGAQACVSFKPN